MSIKKGRKILGLSSTKPVSNPGVHRVDESSVVVIKKGSVTSVGRRSDEYLTLDEQKHREDAIRNAALSSRSSDNGRRVEQSGAPNESSGNNEVPNVAQNHSGRAKLHRKIPTLSITKNSARTGSEQVADSNEFVSAVDDAGGVSNKGVGEVMESEVDSSGSAATVQYQTYRDIKKDNYIPTFNFTPKNVSEEKASRSDDSGGQLERHYPQHVRKHASNNDKAEKKYRGGATAADGDDSSDQESVRNKKPKRNDKEQISDKYKLNIATISGRIGDEFADYGRARFGRVQRSVDKRKKVAKSSQNNKKVIQDVVIPDYISVSELAKRMSEKSSDIVKALMKLGVMATINQNIDADTAELVVEELGHRCRRFNSEKWVSGLLAEDDSREKQITAKVPVVTIMGHIDHGKTSLLDALRLTDIAADEFGSITQHIGAYQVITKNHKAITFLDTPGHEAFTAMRVRGTSVTDIVVIVVAANDGIKPQTVEAIDHAKLAKVPIIVVINKIDLPDSNVDRIKHDLCNYDLIPEEMGGETMVIQVSAKKRVGLEQLEEAILLQAAFLDHKVDQSKRATGTVIESKMDKSKGTTASLLVQDGILSLRDIVVVGSVSGRVKSMHNDRGAPTVAAHPSHPVEITGLSSVPAAGERFVVVKDEKVAKELTDFYQQKEVNEKFALSAKSDSTTIDQIFQNIQSDVKILNIILKTDVHGSGEAIVDSLGKISHDAVQLNIVRRAVGGITESDVILAAASNAIVVGFNVRANADAVSLAKKRGIEIKYYSIIYGLIEEIHNALNGLLTPILDEKVIGSVEVRRVFNLTKYGKIAGCYVQSGVVSRSASVRILRDDVVIFTGKIKSLRKSTEDVKEVKAGLECGIAVENYHDIKEGDKLEIFEVIEQQRSIHD